MMLVHCLTLKTATREKLQVPRSGSKFPVKSNIYDVLLESLLSITADTVMSAHVGVVSLCVVTMSAAHVGVVTVSNAADVDLTAVTVEDAREMHCSMF